MWPIGTDGKLDRKRIAAVIMAVVFVGFGAYRYSPWFAEFVYQEPSFQRASLPRLSVGQTLEFGNGQNESALLSGWSGREPGGVWSLGGAAYLGFLVETESISAPELPGKLTIRAEAFVVPGKLPKQTVEAWSSGTKRGTYTLEGDAEFTVSLDPVAVKQGSPLTVAFNLPDARSPFEIDNKKGDGRKLAIFLKSVLALP
jgi:hypothetical protein